jgi:hypothetical protein
MSRRISMTLDQMLSTTTTTTGRSSSSSSPSTRRPLSGKRGSMGF